MKQMDMHMHSYFSDGNKDLHQIAKEVEEKGLSLFSLTDHDCISGTNEMKEIMKSKAINFLPGVEISSTFKMMEFHLLVYNYDDQNQDFLNLLASNIKIRFLYDQDLITELVKLKTPGVSLDDFNAFEDEPYRGGWPSINYLMSIGLVKEFKDYIKLTACVPRMVFPKPKEVIDIAHGCGAKVILAHPSSNERGGLRHEILDQFLEDGIDGMECFSPYHTSEEEVNAYIHYCRANGLVVSGGSDYHGGYIGRAMGVPKVMSDKADYDFFMDLIEKI